MDKKTLSGYISAFLMALIIGFQFVIIKNVSKSFEGTQLALLFFRFLFAFLISTPLYFIMLKKEQALKLIKSIFCLKTFLLCLIQPFLNLLAQTFGALSADVFTIACVSATGPLISAVFGKAVNKEKLSLKQVIALIVITVGAVVSLLGDNSQVKLKAAGILLSLSALILRSLYGSLIKKIPAYEPAQITTAQLFWGMIFFGLSAAIFKQLNEKSISALLNLRNASLGGFLYISFLSVAVLYALNNFTLNKLTLGAVGAMNNLTFIVMLFSCAAFEGKELNPINIAGAVGIIAGIFFFTKSGEKKKGT